MKLALVTIPITSMATMFALAPAGQAPPAAKATVAYVSAQRILTESTEGKAKLARGQALQQQRAADLKTKQQTLEATRQQLAQATDNSARARLLQQEQQQRLELERATGQAQIDLQTLERQANNELLGRVKAVLDDVTKGQDVQLVLNADTAVMWAATSLDLTAAVIQKLNDTAPASPKP